MIPSDQPSSPYKKHLNNRIFPFRSCCQNISVFSARICDLLFLSNLFHTVYQFPVFDRTFKLQILRGGIHFFFQLFQDHIIISIQKLQHFRDRRPVVFLRNIALTRSVALLDMIIKTRTFFPDIFWKISIAAPYMVQFMDQINRISNRLRARVRTEVFCLIFQHFPCQQNSRKGFIHRHFDKWICFIIHQHRIVFWMMFFDQITL